MVTEEEGGSGKFGTNLWTASHDVFDKGCTGVWPETQVYQAVVVASMTSRSVHRRKCILFEEKKQYQMLVLIGIDPDNSVKEADSYSFGTKDPQVLGPSVSSPDSNSWGD